MPPHRRKRAVLRTAWASHHCNAGGLATAKYGTALAPMYLAHERGLNIKVFADETRPVLQGARLTAFELQQAGIDVTLLADNMAAMVMSKGGFKRLSSVPIASPQTAMSPTRSERTE